MATVPTKLATGGFGPQLRRDDITVGSGAKFLASEKYTAKRGGITLSAALVTADADGNKILKAGTFVTPATSGAETGKYGQFASGATDGTQTPDANVSGYLFEDVNLRAGDVITGLLIQGSVLTARVTPTPVPAAVATAVAGRITFQ